MSDLPSMPELPGVEYQETTPLVVTECPQTTILIKYDDSTARKTNDIGKKGIFTTAAALLVGGFITSLISTPICIACDEGEIACGISAFGDVFIVGSVILGIIGCCKRK